jgi:lantibiotic modifying enzyme
MSTPAETTNREAATVNSMLAAAKRIGHTLCETAYWDEARQHCTWMGHTDIVPFSPTNETAFAAIGPHLYSGTTGVALFLAELYGQTRDAQFKSVSVAALKRSLHYLKRHPVQNSPLSVFSAHLGVAYVTARFVDIGLGDGLEDDLQWLIDQSLDALKAPHLLDLINGNAGAIPVLLALARRPGFQMCLDAARTCGEELCSTAIRQNGLCVWDTERAVGPGMNAPPMTGFSHGASGMALALLELYAQTGSAAFLDTARRAFAYEDTFFSRGSGNWLDLRAPHRVVEDELAGTFATVWCHGAPGIGLARLRAMSLDPESRDDYERMARIALTTTTSAIEQSLATPRSDATLCHGLSGLAEVALIFGEVLDDDGCRALAADTASKIIRLYGDRGDWPSGTTTGKLNPTLMLGNAGVGHQFLRLHAPQDISSILLITPSKGHNLRRDG